MNRTRDHTGVLRRGIPPTLELQPLSTANCVTPLHCNWGNLRWCWGNAIEFRQLQEAAAGKLPRLSGTVPKHIGYALGLCGHSTTTITGLRVMYSCGEVHCLQCLRQRTLFLVQISLPGTVQHSIVVRSWGVQVLAFRAYPDVPASSHRCFCQNELSRDKAVRLMPKRAIS